MPPQGPPNYQSDFPSICASYDRGGGVGLHDAFVVYTTNQSRPHPKFLDPRTLKTLTNLAANVASHVKIHYTQPPNAHLRTLPHTPAAHHSQLAKKVLDSRDRPHTPSFFVNVSSSEEVCIAGIRDAVTTLLAVLRRAWCVLELCEAGAKAVTALLTFVAVAESLDRQGYTGAVASLRYQRDCHIAEERESGIIDGLNWSQKVEGFDKREKDDRLREICAALFRSSLDSFNGFYIRAIAACAVELRVQWGDMGRVLAVKEDALKHLTPRQLVDGVQRQLPGRSLVSIRQILKLPSSRRSGLSRSLTALLDQEQVERIMNTIEYMENVTTPAPLNDQVPFFAQATPKIFLQLYRDVLERLTFATT